MVGHQLVRYEESEFVMSFDGYDASDAEKAQACLRMLNPENTIEKLKARVIELEGTIAYLNNVIAELRKETNEHL